MLAVALLFLTAADIQGAAMAADGQIHTWTAPGGCWTPSFGLVLQAEDHTLNAERGGRMDRNVYLADCLEATLFGRQGILLIHRNAQVRFYEQPDNAGDRWPYTEIYSIYTPSAQTGLLVRDINGDGRPDIYAGNYWIESPTAFELPWRLFAIHPHYKQPLSASLRFAEGFGGIVEAQWEFPDKPVFSVFRKPANPHDLWIEQPLAAKVRRPRALLAIGGGLLVGEDMGESSRVLWIASPQDPGRVIAEPGVGAIALFYAPRSGTHEALLVTRAGVQRIRW